MCLTPARAALAEKGLRQSTSAKGNCYDNAPAESFFSRFKAELVEDGIFEDTAQSKAETFSYIEGYYNRPRLQSSLGYKSPLEFEREWKMKNERSSERVVSAFFLTTSEPQPTDHRRYECGRVHLPVSGRYASRRTTPVRIHSQCTAGEIFGSTKRDCGPQLQRALELGS